MDCASAVNQPITAAVVVDWHGRGWSCAGRLGRADLCEDMACSPGGSVGEHVPSRGTHVQRS